MLKDTYSRLLRSQRLHFSYSNGQTTAGLFSSGNQTLIKIKVTEFGERATIMGHNLGIMPCYEKLSAGQCF